MSLTSLTKIVKCAQNDDVVTLRADESHDVLGLLFESRKGKDRVGEYEMKLMDIDTEHLGIPDTVYDAEISLPATEFRRIIGDLKELGESVKIEVSKDGVRFSADGDIGSAAVTLKQTGGGDDMDEDSDEEEEEEESEEEAKEEEDDDEVSPTEGMASNGERVLTVVAPRFHRRTRSLRLTLTARLLSRRRKRRRRPRRSARVRQRPRRTAQRRRRRMTRPTRLPSRSSRASASPSPSSTSATLQSRLLSATTFT